MVKTVQVKRPVGRPRKTLSDYLPEGWQQTIFEMSAQGCSDVEIRAAFCWDGKSFNHNAWDGMMEREAEFLTTIKKAKVLCQAWWEKVSREGLHDPNFQTGNWYANMKNRFGWKDKVDIEHGVSDKLLEKYKEATNDELENRFNALCGRN